MKLRHRLFEHVLLMLLLALAIFGAAIVLAWMAQWAGTLQLPTYLVYGMHLIGMVLFFLDGCVVVAASSTLAARLYQFPSKEDMNTLHPLFTLRHPRRFWLTSLAIAVICAIVLAPWLDNSPWLVAIPLVVGGLLVALGELWEELHGKRLSGNDQATPCRRP